VGAGGGAGGAAQGCSAGPPMVAVALGFDP